MRNTSIILAMFFGYAVNATAQVKTTDSVFIHHSRPIEFVVNKINVSDADRRWITDSLIPQLRALGDRGIILGRATASPEGPPDNNLRLARSRRAAVDALLSSYGIDTRRIRYDVVSQDFPLLHTLMWMQNDEKLPVVERLMRQYLGNDFLSADVEKGEKLKLALKKLDGGRLWQYILRKYFPQLRAVRIMAIDQKLVDVPQLSELASASNLGAWRLTSPLPSQEMFVHADVPFGISEREEERSPRRELLSVKTNLLFDFAYMPGYDRFCPIPNVAIEYYPLHGHLTYGASFDGPWWQHYKAHKYFQLRNYQLHTRYYFRNGDIRLRKPGEGAAFKGLFVSAYAHAYLYNICFGEKRGWEGEGWGAGLGIGYVLPLGKKEHWRLEFGLQAGYLQTDYDPYQWRCPVDPDKDPERYYYKWYGDAKDFKKRQHRYSWLGPTRLEVTLSYDLLYRKRNQTK